MWSCYCFLRLVRKNTLLPMHICFRIMCNFLCASQERPYFACKLLKLSTLVRSCSSSMPNPWSWNDHQTRTSMPSFLTAFQSQMLMCGNLVNTSGDYLFLKLNQILSLDGIFNPMFLKSKKKARRFRFTPNPKIRVSLILGNCLEGTITLHMIADKRRKMP